MRLRLKLAVAASALAALPVALAATPAQAATTYTVKSTITMDSLYGSIDGTWGVAGKDYVDRPGFDMETTFPDPLYGSYPADTAGDPIGTIELQRSYAGGAWANVTSVAANAYSFADAEMPLVENVCYRIYYTGGHTTVEDDNGNTDNVTYAPAVSTPKCITVSRRIEKIKLNKKKMTVSATIVGLAHGKVTIQWSKKHDTGPYKKYKVVKTNAAGRFTVKLKAPSSLSGTYYYRAIVPGDAGNRHFVPATSGLAETFKHLV